MSAEGVRYIFTVLTADKMVEISASDEGLAGFGRVKEGQMTLVGRTVRNGSAGVNTVYLS